VSVQQRHHVTGTGLQDALFTHVTHDQLLRTGLAELTDPGHPQLLALSAAPRWHFED
jgi:hypothetical protein